MELNSWHYLQDGVAAGHFLGDIDTLEATTLNATHNRYGHAGVEVVVTTEVRDLAASATDLEAVASTSSSKAAPALLNGIRLLARDPHVAPPGETEDARTKRVKHRVVLYGDGQLASKPDSAAESLAWASLLSFQSGGEVAETLGGANSAAFGVPGAKARLARLATCASGPSARQQLDPVFVGLFKDGEVPSESRAKVYACLHAWWESEDELEERRADIMRAKQANLFKAAYLLPEPRLASAKLPQREFFNGGGIGINLSIHHALERDIFSSLSFELIAGAPRYTTLGLAQFGIYAEMLPPSSSAHAPTSYGHFADAVALGPGLEWRPFWGALPVMSSFRTTFLFWTDYADVTPAFRWTPVALLIHDGRDDTIALGIHGGYDELHKASVGVALDVGWWPNQ
jgi:hypothetical protein